MACEYSGRVRDAFLAKGHDAMSCDLLPTDVPGPHYQGNVMDIISDGWDMMIAHPPCTYLTVAGLHWNSRTPGRAKKTEDALQFFRLLLDAAIPLKAIENPISCVSSRIRKPDQIIQPWQFGEDASKATCLWLVGLPPLVIDPAAAFPPRMVCCGAVLADEVGRYGCPNCNGENAARPRWSNQTNSGQNKLAPSPDRWKERSRTYPSIAAAMADQWSDTQ